MCTAGEFGGSLPPCSWASSSVSAGFGGDDQHAHAVPVRTFPCIGGSRDDIAAFDAQTLRSIHNAEPHVAVKAVALDRDADSHRAACRHVDVGRVQDERECPGPPFGR